MNHLTMWERMLIRTELERDQARAELVRVHTDVWAVTNDVRVMGYDGETAVRMVRAALVGRMADTLADTGHPSE